MNCFKLVLNVNVNRMVRDEQLDGVALRGVVGVSVARGAGSFSEETADGTTTVEARRSVAETA